MKKSCCLMAFLMLFIINTLSCEAEENTVAVIPLEDISMYNEKFSDLDPASVMTEELTAAFSKSGQYNMISRNKIDKVLDDMGFLTNEAIDQESAIEIGKMLGAQYVVVGKVAILRLSAAGKVLGLKSHSSRSRAKLSLRYRLVDVQTGEIKFAGTVKGEGEGTGDDDTVMYEACQDAAQNVLKDVLIDLRVKIADISSDKIYIDGGKRFGFSEGETLVVVRDTRPIEINGKVVGLEETELGNILIIDIKDDYAVCKITKQNGGIIQKGDFVRRAKKKK